MTMKATTIIVSALSVLLIAVPCHGIDSWSDEYLRVPSEYPTIQDAIDAAMDGDIVLVAPGVYTGEGNRDIDFLGKAITVKSAYGQEYTVIDCQDEGRGFYFHTLENVESILDGFTITNGWDYEGGGIYCYDSSSPIIMNCTISGNTTYKYGGGVYCNHFSCPIITNCTISGNTSDYGGGIYSQYSSPTITNCALTGNTAYGAYSQGGGIYCDESFPVITNCTITGNTALHYGGGIYSQYSSPTITNCILWNDLPEEVYGNAAIKYSDVEDGWYGEGNIDENPRFIAPSEGKFQLLPSSPCIDSGAPTFEVPPGGGSRIDMGACEYWHGWNIAKSLYLD